MNDDNIKGVSSIKETWIDVYIRNKHEDPHTVFAERLGTTRQEAKVLHLRISCEIPFIKGYMKEMNKCKRLTDSNPPRA